MDAISLIARPMPSTPPASPGTAPTTKPSTASGKPDDAPAFAPADQESSQPPTTDKPAATKDAKPTLGKDEAKPAEASDGTKPEDTAAAQDQDAVADQVATAVATSDALLITQQIAPPTPNTPTAMPVIAPVVAAAPQENTTVAQQTDAAAAITIVGGKASKPATTSTTPATSTAAATTATPANASPGNPAATAPAQPDASAPQATATPAPTAGAPQAQAGVEPLAATSDTKVKASDAPLDGAKPTTAPSSASPTQTPSPATQTGTTQPGTTQAPPSTQASPVVSAEAEAKPLAVDRKTEVDAIAPARPAAAADTANAPAVSFGTDPGASAHVKSATAAYETARAATPILPASEQVAMQIHRAVGDGVDKVTVELKPAALGRVSAEIEFHDDHRVHVVLSADRPATLDALRSDSRALERALQDAGLRADAGSLSFRFENGSGQSGFKPDSSADGSVLPAASAVRDAAPLPVAAYASFSRPGGVDIHV